ncbi:hypothetical protein BDN72DRAFT_869302 [Pluteus cervinus]|uniref:Uncharacterized protein n=1 Tax=Pluteus cervinus TaxID=181527 RepID=A0ACD3B5G0_9AGAR|nr:hypothetical protein BDN72DRAFT_869302 [Pluteus cervinus]
MSYLIPSPRSYDRPAHDDVHDQHRIHMSSTPFSSYSSTHSPTAPSYPQDHPPVSLPKVGQTRCCKSPPPRSSNDRLTHPIRPRPTPADWTLLSSELNFIYLDPVLASHLEDQAEALIGKSILDFVHPDEQASAKQDLGSVLESRTLHGSVTRVRFSRLSRVRRQLGHTGPGPSWSDAEKIAVDANFMAVDIVINWAAEGLVLCFIHATVDLHDSDNDENNKTGWTNWCGTPALTSDQIALLFRSLLTCVPQPLSGTTSRVFQILANQPQRPLLMTWPPDQGQGPTGSDFSKLVEHVQIGSGIANNTDAKTSCTRRYKALQNMPAVAGEVESIFIPHGTIIFACHKVNSPSRSTATSTATMQQLGYSNPTHYSSQHSQPYYDQQPSTYSLPPLSTTPAPYGSYVPQPSSAVPSPYSPARWSAPGEQPASYNQWNAPSPAHPISPLRPSSPYVEGGPPASAYSNRSISPNYAYSPTAASEGASPSADVVPPPRRRVSPGSTRDQYGPGGRGAGNRPMGVLKCSSCKATQSPEWRKGPSGKKELCNACGLRYARSRAKKEGNAQPSRKRKDKGLSKRESATPPTSASPSYSAMRRSYGDTSFVSTSSNGSGSGSEMYSHSSHHILESATPSPSPPASMNFVHYAPGERQSYSTNSGSFYSTPSPLSNPPVLHHSNQLPPLGQLTSYTDRLSPMLPSASSSNHSPLTSTHPPASFERERDRDRELRDLPPAPLSAEPRPTRRSIITQQ